MLEKRMQEIKERKLEIRGLLQTQDVDLEAVEKELGELEVEERGIEKKMEVAAKINVNEEEVRQIQKPVEKREDVAVMENKNFGVESVEFRNAYLKELMGKELTEVEERALTTAQNSAGAVVPTTTLNKIIDKLVQTSVLFGKVSVSYIAGNVSFAVADVKNDASWKVEGADGTPADDTVKTVTLSGYELIKLAEISAAAKAMTIDAFESYIVEEIGRKMGIAMENAILNGTGSGQPTGLLKAGEITNVGTFTKAGMTYGDVVALLAKLPTMYHTNACLSMNRDLFFKEVAGLVDSNKKPIVVQDVQSQLKFNVLGYPVIIDDYMPADTIILGDFSYYKLNFSQAPQIESDKSAGFKSGKTIYRGLAVVDGKPALAEAFVKYTRALA